MLPVPRWLRLIFCGLMGFMQVMLTLGDLFFLVVAPIAVFTPP